MKTYTFNLKTSEQDMIDLTSYMNQVLCDSHLEMGKMTFFCPHTTAGLTINENADPDVIYDMVNTLNKVFPVKGEYKHFEGNSHAHLKSSFMGTDQTVFVEEGKAILGTWQSVYFCEFDGPRTRTFYVRTEGVYNG